MEDLKGRIERSRNRLEELVHDVPGYRGYKEKEERREADRLLRDTIVRNLEEQRRHLNSIEARLADSGKLRLLMALERANARLQFLIDRIKFASYGYAGAFDAIKIKEAELDALYGFDMQLLASVRQVEGWVSALGSAGSDDEVQKSADVLLNGLQELNDLFSRRQDAILGAAGA